MGSKPGMRPLHGRYAGGGKIGFFAGEFGALFDELRHDTDRYFRHTPGFYFDADGAGDALQLRGGGDFFITKMIEDDTGFARAANHGVPARRAGGRASQ